VTLTASRYLVGIDIGSTTIKAVAVAPGRDGILWQHYERHEARQPERLLDLLRRLEADLGISPANTRVFVTGSGGTALAPVIGAQFIQEVVAVSFAVEALHPDANSVIELGGQDAKILVFADGGQPGSRKKIASMNDRCAGGTGAVIDKITAKLRIPAADLGRLRYAGVRIHPVAGKCGVFAETDINSLQKQGVPTDELMASLFEAIVLQNLTVLARGNTLRARVLLLGGPNTFIVGMREAWQANIPKVWAEREIAVPGTAAIDDLITVPDRAEYFAAMGAAEAGRREDEAVGRYRGMAALDRHVRVDRVKERAMSGTAGLRGSDDALAAFTRRYAPAPFVPPRLAPGAVVHAFLGVDGGSTSTKAVLVSESGDVLAKAYRLSQGNPIQDTIDLLKGLEYQIERQGARLDVLGAGTTGYAKDILREVFNADVALVETVAHAQAALQYFADPHVIVDVGGQDIKLIVLKDGRVKEFRLNTQCSAGNGYFLQSIAEAWGLCVEEYAQRAFAARRMPIFGYGCAVFLQSDIVNAQRQGWQPEEILAGLAAVLPKNIFYYVAAVASPARLGTRFVLQGGTQNNLAVVKAEVDFIRAAFDGTGTEPHIFVHPHRGESGAIGAALEAIRLVHEGRRTTFIGVAAAQAIVYRMQCNEETRCSFCKNACLRTFVDVRLPAGAERATTRDAAPGAWQARRFVMATCEQGAAQNATEMRDIKSEIDAVKAAHPNLVEIAAREVWKPQRPPHVADAIPPRAWTPRMRTRTARLRRRSQLRIGIPRALNFYAYAPLFSAYFESLGVAPANIVYSDYTSTQLYRSGGSRGAIDPCFPSKVALAHVHNLVRVKHARRPLDCVFFPMFDVLESSLVNVRANNACPTAAVTPEVIKAAFTRETDVFADSGMAYLDPIVDLSNRRLFARQMLRCWDPYLGLSEAENWRAVEAGFAAYDACWAAIRARARLALDALEREDRLGIVVLARPYHHDPGVNHDILEQLQKLGYPIFSQHTLPHDEDLLARLFGGEVRAGTIAHPFDISDVWRHTSASSTNQKIWAAKFVARHPNLVALELSSFKCGHDAPIYSVVEQIIECSGTPFFAFKDIDENRPLGSIRIRIETIDYALRRYRERFVRRSQARASIERELAAYEAGLRSGLAGPPGATALAHALAARNRTVASVEG
jgi:activator of 2-hydroxyglutaryl-CoA dehydratase/predicted nucleotide-binding protein (sugar kinase/HSP70/actin superfamily)